MSYVHVKSSMLQRCPRSEIGQGLLGDFDGLFNDNWLGWLALRFG